MIFAKNLFAEEGTTFNTVIAFDKEVRSYGGFEALVPASALDNIK